VSFSFAFDPYAVSIAAIKRLLLVIHHPFEQLLPFCFLVTLMTMRYFQQLVD